MRLLLDTHIVLWQLAGSDRVHSVYNTIEQATELRFSVVSFAEIGVKSAAGKLDAPKDLYDHVMRTGVRLLPLDAEHGLEVADLPLHHRDPFDRLLIAQARRERLTIVTADRRFAAYEVPLVEVP